MPSAEAGEFRTSRRWDNTLGCILLTSHWYKINVSAQVPGTSFTALRTHSASVKAAYILRHLDRLISKSPGTLKHIDTPPDSTLQTRRSQLYPTSFLNTRKEVLRKLSLTLTSTLLSLLQRRFTAAKTRIPFARYKSFRSVLCTSFKPQQQPP